MDQDRRISDWERQRDEDQELLTLAAKAAGLPVEWHEVMSADFRSRSMRCYLRELSYHGWDKRFSDCREWAPLTDDGDALRLAVQLRLEVDTEHDPIAVGRGEIGVREWQQGDPARATRRAIVRAAAAHTPHTVQ